MRGVMGWFAGLRRAFRRETVSGARGVGWECEGVIWCLWTVGKGLVGCEAAGVLKGGNDFAAVGVLGGRRAKGSGTSESECVEVPESELSASVGFKAGAGMGTGICFAGEEDLAGACLAGVCFAGDRRLFRRGCAEGGTSSSDSKPIDKSYEDSDSSGFCVAGSSSFSESSTGSVSPEEDSESLVCRLSGCLNGGRVY